MSKPEDDFYGQGLAVGDYMPDSLNGQLLTVIEMLGLKQEQETAVKTHVSRIIYDTFRNSIPLKATTYTELKCRHQSMDAQAQLDGTLLGEGL